MALLGGFLGEMALAEAIRGQRQAGGSPQASGAWDASAVSRPGAMDVRSALPGVYAEKSAGPAQGVPVRAVQRHLMQKLLVAPVAVELCTRAVARSAEQSCAVLAAVAV